MGYGLPAAIAAKLRNPDKTVIALAGDGCFQMTENEFATAVQYNAGVIVFVVDNEMYGTIRMHQHKNYKGKYKHTGLINPDFNKLAFAMGGQGYTVEKTQDFMSIYDEAKEWTINIIYHRYCILKLVLKWFYLEKDLVLYDDNLKLFKVKSSSKTTSSDFNSSIFLAQTCSMTFASSSFKIS